MSEFRPIAFILGIVLGVLAILMLLPALSDAAAANPDWRAFVTSALITGALGAMLVTATRAPAGGLTVHSVFLLVVTLWVVVAAFSALPFLFAGLKLNYADAFFEAISGLTTTGATVLVGLDTMPPGILLWRALLQWLGGIGIVMMAIAVLPYLRVGGMQLFQAESSDRSGKIRPRAEQIAKSIGTLYLVMTVAAGVGYVLTGMEAFDAMVHAMTTIATAGFSSKDASFAAFGPGAHLVAIIGMIAGALPFALYLRMRRDGALSLFGNDQVQFFLVLVAVAAAIAAAWLIWTEAYTTFESILLALFNVVSIATTTGYASGDYQAWGAPMVVLFFLLMFTGGCTGSTTGSIKSFRLHALLRVVRTVLRQMTLKHGVFTTTYEGKPLSPDVVLSVASFVLAYLSSVGVLALALGALGLDFITALSGAASAVGNFGPALGPIIGPAGTYQSLPDTAKWLLSLGMLVGRLEIFTVLVLLTPHFWRR